MGDRIATKVGVICDPEIKEYKITKQDKLVVVASDGVWEFLSNMDVAKIVYPYFEKNAPEAAANALVKEALKTWKKEEEVVDDITGVIIFLDSSRT
jgi:serine/threonine protein phosphatase PrpC